MIILIATVGFVLLANPKEEMENTAKGLDYEKIYEHKTRYVGNASKVSGLANHLYYAALKDGISLKTEAKPYGMTVNYNIEAEDFMEYDSIQLTDKMLKNAAVLFCLIDNVEQINFNFNDGSSIHSFPFEREFFNGIFGGDIRNYASSFNKFRNEFVPMIDSSFTKEDMMTISDAIIFNGKSSSIGVFGEGFNQDESWDIGMKVEELLQTIMSSPKESSNPKDYIKAHQDAYETIVKMGDEALQYMLSLFDQGEDQGLKAHIMMALCIDLLGDRNNVEENAYTSPKEWYAKLSPYEAVKLPPFQYQPKSDMEELVYTAVLKQYSQQPEKFCQPRGDIARAMMAHYNDYKDLFELMNDHLTYYLKENNIKGVQLQKHSGDIIPLT